MLWPLFLHADVKRAHASLLQNRFFQTVKIDFRTQLGVPHARKRL